MSSSSNIEWTDATWNPIVGCTIVSPGCTNCYAMRMAARIEKMRPPERRGTAILPHHYSALTKPSNAGPVWTGRVNIAPDHILIAPLSWRKPKRIFVNSMGDLFHESIPDEWIDRVFAVMALCPQHTFQVLTKRAERMRAYLSAARAHPVGLEALGLSLDAHARDAKSTVGTGIMLQGDIAHLKVWPLPNVWLGVSAERQQEWDERKRHLKNTLAAVKFASFEPLLGPIVDRSPLSIFINWAIVGGESGPKARPMHPDWARSIRDQCEAAGVPFFFKQWGAWKSLDQITDKVIEGANGHGVISVDGRFVSDTDIADPPRSVFTFKFGKASAGRLLDGVEHNGMPS